MIPNRKQRFGEVLRKEIIRIITTRLRDPRIGFITINDVIVTGDFKAATVYYTVIGDEKVKKDTGKLLNGASGFIRKELLLCHLNVKTIPLISFKYDISLDYGEHIDNILKGIKHS
ncbi:MAG: 30S ribosome-binding factor RbfA [Deltaproteobacteria bacterium]|nr:30S ribosome-binding factor RbfA [Deltaproteobacteria bacterium]MCL5792993.1 30S ribosome-binding factor RbfA [Deltaproteobacteria bacterium]